VKGNTEKTKLGRLDLFLSEQQLKISENCSEDFSR
jgi:hypothetical protein